MKKLFVLVILLSFCTFAQQTKKEKLIDSLLVVMELENTIRQQIEPSFQQLLPTLAENLGVKENDPMLLEFMDSVKVIAREALSFERIKTKFIAVYAEILSESEAAEALRFFSTSAGKKMQSSNALVIKRAEQIGEEAMQAQQGRIEAALTAISEKYQLTE